jgi:16S rRNA (guanine1207-N2)-methyltransferase
MPGSHYFDQDPAVPSRPRTVTLSLPDVRLDLTTDRGVFAGTSPAVDAGTLVLLRAAPAPPRAGALLDLGCGYGPIAVTLARRSPGATVWAVDVNDRALELVEANAAGAGVTNVRAARPGDVPPELRFAAIYSNPPVRIGKEPLHELLGTWLPRLDGGAAAWLVVHKHLGSDSLARWLIGEGWPTERLGSQRGYRVLEVRAT